MSNRFVRSLFRSAWPTPSIDRLLRAATLRDEDLAAAAWRDFEAAADFDRLTAGEMRLIGLAAKRLARLAPKSPMRARIGGIERANWSRSQLAIGEAGSGLRQLAAASIDVLLIKGAARSALGGPAARGRIVNDIDVVVRPEEIAKAFELLIDDDWQPAGSGTVSYHRALLPDVIGINLVRGQFGNLDLHRTPFHPPYASIGDDAAIWSRAAVVAIAGTNAHVPSPTDFATIAIAHGSLDAHKSSDWLADVADCVDRGIDWDLFESEVDRRGLDAPAAIGLGYVHTRLDRPVPEAMLSRLETHAFRRPLAMFGALSESRPKTGKVGFFWLTRAIAKQSRLLRLWRSKSSAGRRRVVLPSPLGGGDVVPGGPKALAQPLALPDRKPGEAWSGSIDLSLAVELPAVARRVDFEIISKRKHHLRLRALVRNRGRRVRLLRFKFSLSLLAEDGEPVLTATESRRFNAGAPAELIERYGALPFSLVRFKATPSQRRPRA
jgi:hypothetical protein